MRSCMGLALLVLTLIAGTACGNEDDSGSPDSDAGRLKVVTTVAPITSIVANVVGDLADIEGVVPEGTNSHTFEPPPSVAELMATADVVFINGLQLEEPTKELAETNMPDESVLVELGTKTIAPAEYKYDFSFPKKDGKPNPHLWTDPAFAKRYAEIVGDTMAERDPDNAQTYRRNYDAFAAVVDEFDEAMRTSFATIAKDKRKLLTYHDAYAYFAEDYDWEVIGAIQVADFGDPSPKEVAALIEQIRTEGVPRSSGQRCSRAPCSHRSAGKPTSDYVDELRDDDLPGKPGEAEHSWLGLMRFDYSTMTAALGGDASAIKGVVVRNVATDSARYPQ